MANTLRQNRSARASSGTSAVLTAILTQSVLSGDLLVAVIGALGSGPATPSFPTISTPSTSGLSWQFVASLTSFHHVNLNPVLNTNCNRLSVYYVPNSPAVLAGTNTSVTVTASLGIQAVQIEIYEFTNSIISDVPNNLLATLNKSVSESTPVAPSAGGSIQVSPGGLVIVGLAPNIVSNPGSGYNGIFSPTVTEFALNPATGSIGTGFGAGTTLNSYSCLALSFGLSPEAGGIAGLQNVWISS